MFMSNTPNSGDRMDINESFVKGRRADQALCEDIIYSGEHFVAVLDGATDKSALRYDDMTGGRFAALVLAAALDELGAEADLTDCVKYLSARLNDAIMLACNDEPADRPCAVAGIYSRRRRQLWRIGDVGLRIADRALLASKRIDVVTGSARAAMTAALLEDGVTPEQVRDSDPGRAFILPLLERQHVFANHLTSRWGYAALNGRPVPSHLLECYNVPAGTDIVIASDGYPHPEGTLAAAELALASSLANDPFRVDEDYGTKGVAPDAESFDDRAYVRLHT
jgi:glycerophosphoryl diester phosphodiesterase